MIELFIQWVYTRRYNERMGQVKDFSSYSTTGHDMEPTDASDSTMAWSAKAGMLAWELGRCLQCAGFQNYAMRRVFAAFSWGQERPLSVWVLHFACDGARAVDSGEHTRLRDFVVDVVLRSWGDRGVVDHGREEVWLSLFAGCASFQKKFFRASMRTLGERRQTPLLLDRYLVKDVDGGG